MATIQGPSYMEKCHKQKCIGAIGKTVAETSIFLLQISITVSYMHTAVSMSLYFIVHSWLIMHSEVVCTFIHSVFDYACCLWYTLHKAIAKPVFNQLRF